MKQFQDLSERKREEVDELSAYADHNGLVLALIGPTQKEFEDAIDAAQDGKFTLTYRIRAVPKVVCDPEEPTCGSLGFSTGLRRNTSERHNTNASCGSLISVSN